MLHRLIAGPRSAVIPSWGPNARLPNDQLIVQALPEDMIAVIAAQLMLREQTRV
ncbi:hypothetical protein ACVIJ6_006507 [Bradyrhizobium sp. USDA 4369]